MSARPLWRSVIVLVVAGGIFLVPVTPARAAGLSLRDLGGIPREVREQGLLAAFTHLLQSIFQPSGGGMDPNGDH
jgi:hypothetical protein